MENTTNQNTELELNTIKLYYDQDGVLVEKTILRGIDNFLFNYSYYREKSEEYAVISKGSTLNIYDKTDNYKLRYQFILTTEKL